MIARICFSCAVSWFILLAGPAANGVEATGSVYIQQHGSDALLPAERVLATVTSTRPASNALISGERAAIRVPYSPDLAFVLRLKPGKTPGSYALFQFSKRGGDRVLSFRRSGQTRITWLAGRQILFKTEARGGSFRLIPMERLSPGEYGFSERNSRVAYVFGIDEGQPRELTGKRLGEAASDNSSTDVRLNELQHLMDKLLISREDYERKRAELLGHSAGAASKTEQRLQRLEDVYRKGLITKEEYDTQRAAILAAL